MREKQKMEFIKKSKAFVLETAIIIFKRRRLLTQNARRIVHVHTRLLCLHGSDKRAGQLMGALATLVLVEERPSCYGIAQ